MFKVIDKLKDSGYRITQPREVIINLLEKSLVPLSILSIQEKLKEEEHNFNQSTIYRTLELLIKKGLLIRTDCQIEAKYELIKEQKYSRHNLICLVCGNNREISINNDILKLNTKNNDFEEQYVAIKSYGVCTNCRSKKGN